MNIHEQRISKITGVWRELKLRQNHVRKHIWQGWVNPTHQSTPVFLIGCGRSGTSMLVKQLSKSWRVDLFNENNPEAFQKYRLKDYAAIDALIEKSLAQIVVFKPILDTYRSRDLLLRFPDARLIFAYRHFGDVIESSLKRFGESSRLSHVNSWVNNNFQEFAALPPPQKTRDLVCSLWKPDLNPESAAALYWLFYNQLYFDLDLNQEERVKRVCYESVVTDPAREMEALCHFLNLPFEPEIARGIFDSSIKHNPSNAVAPHILAECEDLWQRMRQLKVVQTL